MLVASIYTMLNMSGGSRRRVMAIMGNESPTALTHA